MVHRQRDRFRHDSSVATWLFGITDNVVRHRRRKERWRRWLTGSAEDTAGHLASPAPDPLRHAERDEAARTVYRLLDQLPARDRQVLILFDLEELAADEVAALLEIEAGERAPEAASGPGTLSAPTAKQKRPRAERTGALLNRNPSDNHRAALEHAQDDRGRRLLQEARGLRGLTADQVRRIASRLETAAAPARRPRLVPVAATLVVLLSAGTALAWATGTLQHLPGVRALFSLHAPVSRAPGPSTGAPPAVRLTGVAAPLELPTVVSPDDLEANAPSGANLAAPPTRRRGVLPHPAPGPHEARSDGPPFRRRSPRPRPAHRASGAGQPHRATAAASLRRGPSAQSALAHTPAKPTAGRSPISRGHSLPGGQMSLEPQIAARGVLLSEDRATSATPSSMAPTAHRHGERASAAASCSRNVSVAAGQGRPQRTTAARTLPPSAAVPTPGRAARNALTHCP